MEELGLEQTEEVLDHTVIITIALPGHALGDAIFLEQSVDMLSSGSASPGPNGASRDHGQVFFGKLVCSMSITSWKSGVFDKE